ncbi:hypothetical protein SASPL_138172 [Salvia splendens]|uniref:Uncharacterized protein n=1 Tax=Salvia splendens TaxID=180675 RepID=A0A8X8WUN7_SALSN|nr:hypothetical protein SASPL_138172 [Salvia splendens]
MVILLQSFLDSVAVSLPNTILGELRFNLCFASLIFLLIPSVTLLRVSHTFNIFFIF